MLLFVSFPRPAPQTISVKEHERDRYDFDTTKFYENRFWNHRPDGTQTSRESRGGKKERTTKMRGESGKNDTKEKNHRKRGGKMRKRGRGGGQKESKREGGD